MKFSLFAIALLTIVAASFARADIMSPHYQQPEVICNTKGANAATSPIKGHSVSISTKMVDGSKTAMYAPICLACMVQPRYVPVLHSYVERGGHTQVYVTSAFKLEIGIGISSIQPTNRFPAILTFTNGLVERGTCQFPRNF